MEKIDIKEKVAEGAIFGRSVVELLGGPKEHVEKTMKMLVEKAQDDKNFTMVKHKIFPPEEQEGKMWSTFVELDLLFKRVEVIFDFCYDYLPSSVELVEPSKFFVEARTLSNWINELQARLHATDRLAKESNAIQKVLTQRQASIIRYNILSHLKTQREKVDDLHKLIGIDQKNFDGFIEGLLKRGEIVKKDEYLELSERVKFHDTEKSD